MTSSSKPSWAVLAVVAALLVAASSTSYAAGLAKNSVGTPQLRAGAVVAAKIKNGAVTGPKIKDGSVGRADLAPGVALPVTTQVRRKLAVGDDVLLASVGGISYEGVCISLGSGTAVGRVDIQATQEDGPFNALSGSWVSSVDDVSGIYTGPSGAAPFTSTVVQAGGSGTSLGRAALSGTMQYLERPTSRVDISLTTAGGASASCEMRVTISPTR
ncbi:hypothetical protein [Nocardioides sp.]|uniref:hypothetical protein n=1 Tax=Nocardioides sp. TaxID=35761 RepID=UPI00271647A3|nr:hypothetical protein [Nocardioides sp.]MDO9456057.1 hypothetical protein [Nocardioides sp.]